MATSNRRTFLNVAGFAAGGGLLGATAAGRLGLLAQAPGAPSLAGIPDEILNPIEVSGEAAVPVMGRLPGDRRMYVANITQGEHHLVGSQVMSRVARPAESAGVHEMMTFSGRAGATMPRHAHLSSHAAILVLAGELEIEVDGRRWIMMRGDFANLPPGTPHAWTVRSERGQLSLFTMNDRVGSAFVAMGAPHGSAEPPAMTNHEIAAGKLAQASFAGDFQLRPSTGELPPATRVTNLVLPALPGPYVLLDGGGERFGGNTFLARNPNTNGQFLFIITEGGGGGGVGAHFHARHFENFFAMDGETVGWANGRAAVLKPGDYFQAPPRHLHGFRLTQAYNRFAAFLTPGIFEPFFMRGGGGVNGAGGRAGQARGAGGGREGGGRAGEARGEGARRGGGGPEMFRALQMSGRGPDGYPLDVHPAKLPLPPQDPIWTQGQAADPLKDRAAFLAHAEAICGVPIRREITPELAVALRLKPRPEEFV